LGFYWGTKGRRITEKRIYTGDLEENSTPVLVWGKIIIITTENDIFYFNIFFIAIAFNAAFPFV
jgi:hypothetical protein